MADFTVSVTANGLVPAVIYAGNENSTGKTIEFDFSSDWDELTKEVMFFDMRGNVITAWVTDGVAVSIPVELTYYGGHHKYTVRGFSVDNGYIDDELQVTGTIVTTYTAGNNPRMEGKLIPSTLDQFLATAETSMHQQLQEAKDSGEFDGADGAPGTNGQDGTSCGFGTVSASAVTVGPNDPASVSVETTGTDEAKNFSFSFGIPQGQPATNIASGIKILGHYTSLQDLQTAVTDPEPGDAYSVGSYTPYNLYIFDGLTQAWANYGAIETTPVTVDSAMSDESENPVQNKVVKEYVDEEIADAISDIPAYQAQHTTVSAKLLAASWTGENTQSITVSGVTSFNTVIVSTDSTSYQEWAECGVFCTGQSANTLTFQCVDIPTHDLWVLVAILGVIE